MNFTSLLATVPFWLQLIAAFTAFLGFLSFGIVAAFAAYDRVRSGRATRADQLDSDLIEKLERNLAETQKELTHVHNNQLQKLATDKELDKLRQEEKIKDAEEFGKMKGQYENVLAILQGRNKEMDSVIAGAPPVFAAAIETNTLVKEISKSVIRLVQVLEKHTAAIEESTSSIPVNPVETKTTTESHSTTVAVK